MTDDQIKHMVDRFLGWRLPENFSPDAGISFERTYNEHTPYPMKHEPIGTNLFDAQQAEQMVRYMVEGMPCRPNPEAQAATPKEERFVPITALREERAEKKQLREELRQYREWQAQLSQRIQQLPPTAAEVDSFAPVPRSPVESVPVSALRELAAEWESRSMPKHNDYIDVSAEKRAYEECADRLSAVIRGTK